MPKVRITQSWLERVRPPKAGSVDYFDPGIGGFSLRLGSTGRGTWRLTTRVAGAQVAIKLGRHPGMDVDAARAAATAAQQQVDQGRDPRQQAAVAKAAVVQAQGDTFGKAASLYKARHLDGLRSGAELWAAFERDLLPVWGGLPLADLTRAEINRLLDEIEVTAGPYARNRRASLVRQFLFFCWDRELVTHNVAVRIRMLSEATRDRLLSDPEVFQVWHAAGQLEQTHTGFIRQLFLTGARRGEVGGSRWPELNRAEQHWTVPGSRTKNGLAHLVPLAPPALEIVERQATDGQKPFVFFSPTAPQAAISDLSGLKDDLDLAIARPHEASAPTHPGEVLAVSHLRQPRDRSIPVVIKAQGFAPFTPADVGRLVGMSHDGAWGYARLTDYIAPDTMQCRIVMAFSATAGTDHWRMGLQPWRWHDARRTLRSGLSRLRVPADVRELVIGHLPERLVRTYDVYDALPEKADALGRWAAHLEQIVTSPGGGIVVPFVRTQVA